jgi:crotonobetainyl-CoA:carnitine CoA-transferase CaiB-like acyl-CoA transferase
MVQALDGIRILDLSCGIAGPLGVLQLAEHGADVIKVEPPGGFAERASPASRVYNRSRRSVTLNLRDPEGVRLFRELCATADVLVEAFARGTMASFGLDYAALRKDFPRLIYCSLPAWPTGSRHEKRPGYEALVQARTGQQWENPSFRPGPVFLQSPVASFGAMLLLPVAIMAALLARENTGLGQRVEVSLLQGVMSLTTQNWNWTEKAGQFLLPKGYPSIHQATVFECADGEWIHAATMSGVPSTRSEAAILGIEDIPMKTLYSLPPQARAEYEAKRRAAYRSRKRDALVAELQAAGLGAEAIVAPHERFNHPQLRATNSVVHVVDPEVGSTTQIGVTLFLNGTPGGVKGPQPLAGAHTQEVLAALGHDAAEIAALRTKGVI